MMLSVNNPDFLVCQKKELESLLTTSPDIEKEIRAIIKDVFYAMKKKMMNTAKGKMAGDPRNAYKAIRTTVYKRILGANINILSKRRASAGGSSYAPARKLDSNPHQRGGNRRPRSARTNQVDGYVGADRGFILRFLNSGTGERTTRYGNRGSISGGGWFESTGKMEMENTAKEISDLIDQAISKRLTREATL